MIDQTNYIYQTIISDMSEGLMVIGFDGVITHLNTAAEIILDKKKEKLIGKKFAISFIRYEENDSFNQAIIDAIYDRTKFHKNIVNYYTGKTLKQLNITTSFLHNNGEKVGIVVVLSDISELVELRDAVKAMERIKSLNSQLELRNKLISETFGRYLSDDILKEILETPSGLQLGGKKREISIMMSDLRSFTNICESLEPSKIIDMLNHYLDKMVEIISKYNGTIIEFLGDGMLVIFGAPLENKNHALNAVLAAIEMQAAMPDINKWNDEQNYPSLKMGIGINSGETIVGNIGSEKKTKYGVMGKHVNLCGRIESYTIGGQVLISPYTRDLIKEPLEITKEFQAKPKGLKSPINISEITGVLGNYNIHCQKIEVDIRPINKYIDIEFFEVHDKDVINHPNKAKIVALSKSNLIIVTNVNLKQFSIIELNCESNIHCRVIQMIEDGYLCSFTTDPKPFLDKINYKGE